MGKEKKERESLLSIELEILPGGVVKEGKGMEELTYPGIEIWIYEAFREQINSALSMQPWDKGMPLKLKIEVYREGE